MVALHFPFPKSLLLWIACSLGDPLSAVKQAPATCWYTAWHSQEFTVVIYFKATPALLWGRHHLSPLQHHFHKGLMSMIIAVIVKLDCQAGPTQENYIKIMLAESCWPNKEDSLN